MEEYYTYMLRCKDNSIYTGITNNLSKRMEAHFFQNKKAAKYTKSHGALKVEIVWKSKSKSLASSLEFHLKKLKKLEKEEIIKGEHLNTYLKGKIDSRRFIKVNLNGILDEGFM